MDYPKVSIIVPCYNQAKFLDDALTSVINQTFTNWECLIINDGSLDETEDVARKWLNIDNRIRYIHKENAGLSHTRNFGINLSQGEFILPLDADDRISENYLEVCLSEIEKSAVKIVYGKTKCFGEQEEDLDFGKPSLQNLLIKNRIHCCGLFRKDDWKATGGYDENMIHGFEDWEFWIHILKRGGQAKLIEECTFFYRIKPISMSTKMNADKGLKSSMINHIFEKHIDLYGYSSPFDLYTEKLKLEDQLKNLHMNISSKQLLRVFFRKIRRRIIGK